VDIERDELLKMSFFCPGIKPIVQANLVFVK